MPGIRRFIMARPGEAAIDDFRGFSPPVSTRSGMRVAENGFTRDSSEAA